VEVLTRPELSALLGGRRSLDAALRSGAWQRALVGTYVAGDVELDLRVRSLAARRVLPPQALVADRCLLWLLGVDVLPPGPARLEVVVARGTLVPKRQDVLTREAALPAHDRCLLAEELPVLRPVRAAADLLRRLLLVEAVVVADAVQHAGLCSAADLQQELVAHARLRGVRQADRAVQLSSRLAESPPESRLRLLLVLAGLAPVPQHQVIEQGVWLARVDLAFPQHRLAVEYDGRAAHLQGDAFVRERRRQNLLLAAGWTVLRYTAEDLRCAPQRVVQEVREALQRAA